MAALMCCCRGFEVEKCGLCFLFVGERREERREKKYGEIDKKLTYARVRECMCDHVYAL